MSLLSNLIDPEIFVQMSDSELERIESALNSELVSNPQIQQILKNKVQQFVPHLKTAK